MCSFLIYYQYLSSLLHIIYRSILISCSSSVLSLLPMLQVHTPMIVSYHCSVYPPLQLHMHLSIVQDSAALLPTFLCCTRYIHNIHVRVFILLRHSFSHFLIIFLCSAGHYFSRPVFSILCNAFSQLVFLDVSLYVVPPSLCRLISAPSPRNF